MLDSQGRGAAMRFRALIFTVGGLAAAAIVAAIAYWFLVLQPHGAPPASVVTATFAPTPAPSSPAAAPAVQASAAKSPAAAPSPASTPAFDIVRVEPSGEAVIAGRAAPSARVELSDDGKAIGDAAANDAGQFVILPAPLSPGRHPLRLSAKVGDGAPQVSDVVVVEVAAAPAAVAAAPAATPSPAAKPAPTVAAAPTPTPAAIPATSAAATPIPAATSAAASTPAPSAKPAATPTPTVAVAVASVRPIDPAGLEAVGSAPAGAHVRLRLNNSVLAEVIAGADGEWRLTIERGLTAGDYVLEAAAIDAAGAILARAEAPFVYPQREAVAIAAPATPAAAPSPAASSPAAVEPTPAALRPSASTPVASAAPAAAPSPAASSPAAPAAVEPTSAASTPVAAAAPSSPPTPAASSAAEPTPTATPAAPAPTARVAAEPAPSAASPASTPAAAETPLATAAHAVVAEVSTYTVVKGDNLWDLAIKYYGDGLRYADIFSANSSQIRDPNLIYIGQIFVVPPNPTTNPPPAR
jgi:hypothetical protein